MAAQTQNLDVQWDPSPDNDVTGYRVSVGTSSRSYGVLQQTVPANQLLLTLPATAGVRYYVGIQAITSRGTSDYTDEIAGGIPLFAAPENRTAAVDTALTPIPFSVNNPGPWTLTYSATGLPPGLSLSASTGVVSGTPTAEGTYNVVATVSYGSASIQRPFAWTINPQVTPVSSAPNSGSGAAQTFALQYSDSLGATDLSSVRVRFGTSSGTGANNCTISYAPPTGQVGLLDDAGTVWNSAALGSGTLQNSQCSVDLASTTVASSGDTLTLRAAVTFRPAFNGAKNIYMLAQSAGGASSGWQAYGTWTVPAATVEAVSVTPNSGSTASQAFTLVYSDSLGAADLTVTRVRFGTSSSTNAGNCTINYNPVTGNISMLNDAGTGWLVGTTVIQNSQCSLDLTNSRPTVGSTTITLTLAVTFTPSFAGTKNIYMLAETSGSSTDWVQRGSWTVPEGASAPPPPPPPPAPPAPASDVVAHWRLDEGTGTTASDDTGVNNGTLANGAAWVSGRFQAGVGFDGIDDYIAVPNMDLAGTAMTFTAWVNSGSFGAENRFIAKESGTTQYWTVGSANVSGVNRLRFRLRTSGGLSTLTASSGDLTPNTWYHVAAVYTGAAMRLYLNGVQVGSLSKSGSITASSAAPVSIGRAPGGSNYLHGAIDDIRIYNRPLTSSEIGDVSRGLTADLAMPSSGGGARQLFMLQYSDSLGTADLAATQVRFGTTYLSGSNTCTVSYNPTTQVVSLLDNAGSTWAGARFGSGTLQNSQCVIDLATSSASLGATTATLNLDVTFSAAFGGTKNIYLQATNAAGTSTGWQARGTWSVPGAALEVVSVTPGSGSGATETFTLLYSDSLGATDLTVTRVRIGTSSSTNWGNCTINYNPVTGNISMMNDAGTSWLVGTTVIQNSQCSLDLTNSRPTIGSTTITLTLAVTFTPSFAGSKNIYMLAQTAGGSSTSWQPRGTWTVP